MHIRILIHLAFAEVSATLFFFFFFIYSTLAYKPCFYMQYNHIPDSECLMRNLRAESRGVRTNFPWYFTTVEQLRDQRWLLSP